MSDAHGIGFRLGRFEIRPAQRQLLADGVPARVGARAFDILVALIDRRDRVVSQRELFDLVWPGAVVEENNLQVHISALRKLLGREAIVTVPGRGYRFAAPLADAGPDPRPAQRPAARTAPQPAADRLPQALTSFVGREREIAQVSDLLARSRLVTLTGTGGCGKTRLALQLARALRPSFPDGVWLAELSALADADWLPRAVCSVFGLAERHDRTATDTLTTQLAGWHALLVLDNAEHLLPACAQLAQALLRHCPGLVLLVTSREKLGLPGEQVSRVPSLSLPEPGRAIPLAELAAFESVALLVERASHHRPGFALGADNAAALVTVCRRLDGIPLAIELAAPWLQVLTACELGARLDSRFTLLAGGSPGALPRQRTLRSMIAWSHDLLTPPQQSLYARLSVFSGGWSLAAAEQVLGEADEPQNALLGVLRALVDKNLVTVTERDGRPRFGMLETLWHDAGARLDARPDAADWQGRHTAWALALAERVELELRGADQGLWMARVDADLDNLRAALARCAASGGDTVSGLRLAAALLSYWPARGLAREGLGWLQRLLPPSGGVATQTPVHAKALFSAGWLSFHLCDYDASARLQGQALHSWTALQDPAGRGHALLGLAWTALTQGDRRQARVLAEEALELQRSRGDRRAMLQILNLLGALADADGELERCCSLMEECVALARQQQDLKALMSSLHNCGTAFATAHGHLAAEGYFQEALALAEVLGDRPATALSLVSVANAARERGDHATAQQHYARSLRITRDIADHNALAKLLGNVARLRLAQGALRSAALLFGAAQLQLEVIGAPLAPSSVAEYESAVQCLRTAMADDRAFDAAWAHGRALSAAEIDQLVNLPLAEGVSTAHRAAQAG
jgi:non-specific serine/threonine protein kinase